MPLTPAEVRATQFATTRVRSGYDVDEVDAFLDIVEVDIAALSGDLQQARDESAVLRTQYSQLQSRLRSAERELAAAHERGSSASSTPLRNDTVEIIRPDPALFTGDAAEVMKIAQVTADEIIAAAEKQAQRIRTDLRSRLETQLSELRDLEATDT
jgi:DivIVA domain-containing protein